MLKKVMVAVVSVAVGILTAGTLAALAQGLSNLTLGSIFSSGIGFMTGTGSTALGSTAALGISTTAGFAQSIAAQGLQTAFGMQNGIDLKSTLIGSLASAAGIGLTRTINQNLGLANTIRQGLDKLSNPLFSLSASAEMIEQNALTQSARIAMDNHQNFDFAELASSAIMAGIGGKSEDQNSMRNQIQQTTNSSVRHIAGNLTHAKLNTLLSGQRFHAEDVLVQSVANGMVDIAGEQLNMQTGQQKIALNEIEERMTEESLASDFESSILSSAINDKYSLNEDALNELYFSDPSKDVASLIYDTKDAIAQYASNLFNKALDTAEQYATSFFQEPSDHTSQSDSANSESLIEDFDINHNQTWYSENKNGLCWENSNKTSLEIDVNIHIPGNTQRAILSTMNFSENLSRKTEEIVINKILENTSISIDKNANVSMESSFFDNEGKYKFNYQYGLDPETKMPHLGAGVSYTFDKFSMKTEFGDIELSGTANVNNIFKPNIKGLCTYTIPAYRSLETNMPLLQGLSMGAAAFLKLPTSFKAFSGTSAVAVFAAPAYASNNNAIPSTISNLNKTLIINFNTYSPKRNHS